MQRVSSSYLLLASCTTHAAFGVVLLELASHSLLVFFSGDLHFPVMALLLWRTYRCPNLRFHYGFTSLTDVQMSEFTLTYTSKYCCLVDPVLLTMFSFLPAWIVEPWMRWICTSRLANVYSSEGRGEGVQTRYSTLNYLSPKGCWDYIPIAPYPAVGKDGRNSEHSKFNGSGLKTLDGIWS